MWNFAVVTFILITISPHGTTGACSEQNMVDCEMKAMYFLHAVNESDDGYNEFCDNLKNSTECPYEVTEECKNQYPAAAESYVKFFKKMSRWCNRTSPDRKAYFKIAFCARMHKRGFHRCYKMRGNWYENGTYDCSYWHFNTCWIEQIGIYCGEEAEELANFVQKVIPESYKEDCFGGVGTIRNYWILNWLALLLLLMRQKFERLIKAGIQDMKEL